MIYIDSNQYFSKQNAGNVQQAGSCVKIKNLTCAQIHMCFPIMLM